VSTAESPAAVDAVNALVARDPYLRALGLAAEEERGETVLVLPPLERHIGMPEAGVVHGGVIAAFLEATATLHLRASNGGADVRALEFTSDFVRRVPLAPTRARAVVVRQGRRFASVRVEAWQAAADRVVAAGYGRFLVVPRD
jgi:uncharacterized protein (TIGR00369 family)